MSQSRSRKKSTSSSRNTQLYRQFPQIDLSEAEPEAQIGTSGDPSGLYSVPAQEGEDIETTDYITEMNKYHSFPSHVLVEMMTMLKTAAFQNTAKGKYSKILSPGHHSGQGPRLNFIPLVASTEVGPD